MEWISMPWHWAVGGIAIALLSVAMTLMGRKFGVSSGFKVLCAYAGAGKKIPYFDMNLKDNRWLMTFIAGGILGAMISVHYLRSPEPVAISQSTIDYLSGLGIAYPESDETGLGFVPTVLFNFANWKGVVLALLGGFFVGFGSRYGEGCTSGHAITGLSHLSLPSFITVVGFLLAGCL
ncbi:MAG: YeeE/YedE family protein [Saprospiraceae bacterium]|nr:YeeE/YedE family protein [Saprospiraceae bacterium]